MHYDPMTGEPINDEEDQVRFDPMTGKPIKQQEEAEEIQYDPMTGEPIKKDIPSAPGGMKETKITKPQIAMIAGGIAVVVIAAVVALCVIFSNPNMTVLRACGKTFGDSGKLVETISKFSSTYTQSDQMLTNTMSYEGSEVEFVMAQTKSKIQMQLFADITGAPKIEGILQIDQEDVRAALPSVNDQVIVYKYTEECTGDLGELVGTDSLEEINQVFYEMVNRSGEEKVLNRLHKEFVKQYKSWDFEKTDKKKLRVDGEKRNCQGYSLELTRDNLEDLMTAVEEIYEEEYEEQIFETYKEVFDDFSTEIRSYSTEELEFYIYRGKLVCIDFPESDLTINFKNSKNWLMDFSIESTGKEIVGISGETNKSEESYQIYLDGKDCGEVKYDYKTGDLGWYADGMEILGTMSASKNKFELIIDEVSEDGETLDFSNTFTIKRGAKFEEISGEEFDLGSASERELNELLEQYAECFREISEEIDDMGMYL